jgi:pyruvate,orthophosphate dikinase
MFLGERRKNVERLILADDPTEQNARCTTCCRCSARTSSASSPRWTGCPVTVRLLDPPLHEFLPSLEELSVEVAVAEATGKDDGLADKRKLLDAVRRLHESNPMLGLRGVRLGLVVPGLFALQVRAIAEAAAECRKRGVDAVVEIMVPLVGAVQELEVIREESEDILRTVAEETGTDIDAMIGTMIELPARR